MGRKARIKYLEETLEWWREQHAIVAKDRNAKDELLRQSMRQNTMWQAENLKLRADRDSDRESHNQAIASVNRQIAGHRETISKLDAELAATRKATKRRGR